MKRLIYLAASSLLALAALSCVPEQILPSDAETEAPLTSVTAYVSLNGYSDLEFTGYPDSTNVVEIVFPFYYPEDSDDEVLFLALTDVRVIANLANNVMLLDKLTKLDLTKENKVRLLDQSKNEVVYTIKGRIAHNSGTEIKDVKFTIKIDEETTVNYSCVVKGDEIIIPIEEELAPGKLTFTLSPHATLYIGGKKIRSGDTVDLNNPVTFKVVADDGTERLVSVHKGTPEKLPKGVNTNPAFVRYLFTKKLADDIGITTHDMTTSLAVCGDYLVINTRGEDLVVLDRITGNKVKTVPLPAECKGDLRNFCITADSEGRILICNLVLYQWVYDDDGKVVEADSHWRDLDMVKIWKMDDLDSAPVEYISWPVTDANLTFGRRISVRGSLADGAIITLPCNTYPATSGFYRWQVVDGELVSTTPEWVSVSESGYSWNNNIDLAYFKPTADSDFIAFGYSDTAREMTWFNGKTLAKRAHLDIVDVNYVPNALDILDFNGTKYLAAAQLNSFTWGRCDFAWLINLDLESNFEGSLNDQGTMGIGATSPAIEWSDISGLWGPHALGLDYGGYANAYHHDDIVLCGSDNGFNMYMYFMFCNGYVVGVQFDCIDRGDS